MTLEKAFKKCIVLTLLICNSGLNYTQVEHFQIGFLTFYLFKYLFGKLCTFKRGKAGPPNLPKLCRCGVCACTMHVLNNGSRAFPQSISDLTWQVSKYG